MDESNQKVYDYIVKYKREYDGLSPSYREIVRHIDASSTSVVKIILTNLEGENRIKIVPGKAGGIMVVGGQWSMVSEERPMYQPEPIDIEWGCHRKAR